MVRKKKTPAKSPPPAGESKRVTYRELRNTPGRVWERLAGDEPLMLVADGETKAIVIPVHDGDADAALEAYERGRALVAMRRIAAFAHKEGLDRTSLADINAMIREVRRELRGHEDAE